MSTAVAARQTSWPSGLRRGWLPADFERERVTWSLGPAEIEALHRAAQHLGIATVADTGAARTRDPMLTEFFNPVAEELRWGRGLVFIRGIPVTGVDIEHVRLLYWIIGGYFGDAVSQNASGTLIGDVAAVGGAAAGRAYASSGALPLHCDRIDILSLLSIRNAASGGENLFGSSLAGWEIVERERPDILPILRRGFRQFRNGEQADGDEPVTPYRVPILAERDGLRSCLVSGNASIQTIAKFVGDEISEAETEALTYFRGLFARPEMQLVVRMQPGEAYFVNNYEVLHGRTAFKDHGGPDGRHLLRLWLQGCPARPRPEQQTVTRNRSGRQGIDPRAGLTLASAPVATPWRRPA